MRTSKITFKIIIVLSILFCSVNLTAQEKNSNQLKNYHNFALDLGYAYRLSSEPNEMFVNQTSNSDHYKSLRHGIQIGFSYDYLIKPFLGLGFKTSAFNSSHSFTYTPNIVPKQDFELKDDEYIFYFGPSIKYIFPTFLDKYNLYARGTFGYLSFRNSEQAYGLNQASQPSTISSVYKGKNIGWGLDLGLDYSINDFLSIGCNAGFFGASITKLKAGEETHSLNKKENLYRLDFTIGVRIRL